MMHSPLSWKRFVWLAVFFGVLIWSAIAPKDYFTWFLEVFPALIGFVLIVVTYRTFPLTPLLYTLILIHMIILMVGGHYTYAEVPLFDWIRDVLHQSRNNYDKVGHFMQGFEPAILAREILLRKRVVLKRGLWLSYIVLSIVLAFSAFYELVEWWVALATGEGAEAFLGTQGYVWDTQSDMMWALIGGIAALVLLSKEHDRELKKLDSSQKD
jgi:putative membrane protein